jgi:predicted PP-loop superfamily ATPase
MSRKGKVLVAMSGGIDSNGQALRQARHFITVSSEIQPGFVSLIKIKTFA